MVDYDECKVSLPYESLNNSATVPFPKHLNPKKHFGFELRKFYFFCKAKFSRRKTVVGVKKSNIYPLERIFSCTLINYHAFVQLIKIEIINNLD